MRFFERKKTKHKNRKINLEFMCVLSDRSIHKKVSLFFAVWPQTCDKREKMFVEKTVHQHKTVPFIENACVFSVSRTKFSSSFVFGEI